MAKDRDTRSLIEKIKTECAANPSFARAHHTVCLFMLVWAVIVALDRLIGVITHAYDGNQMFYALLGGGLLIFVAYLGTRGHIRGAMMLMQINMAVFLIQFTATCFLYQSSTVLWSTLFYGIAAGLLIACSLMLFLRQNLENYRLRIKQLRGKADRQPMFYRTNSRLIRNKNRRSPNPK